MSLTVNIDKVIGQLKGLPGAMRVPLVDLVRQQSKLFISDPRGRMGMMQNTPPANKDARGIAAKKQGENAVVRDITRVYQAPGFAYGLLMAMRGEKVAKFWWQLLKSGDEAKAATMLREETGVSMRPFDGGTAHMAARDRRGRVRRGKFGVVPRIGARDKYITMRKKNVGMHASGLAGAGKILKASIPAWVLRHASRGTALLRMNGGNLSMVMQLDPPFASSQMQRRTRYVLEYRHRALLRQVPYAIRAALKKQGMKAA